MSSDSATAPADGKRLPVDTFENLEEKCSIHDCDAWQCLGLIAKGRRGRVMLCRIKGDPKTLKTTLHTKELQKSNQVCVIKTLCNVDERSRKKIYEEIEILKRLSMKTNKRPTSAVSRPEDVSRCVKFFGLAKSGLKTGGISTPTYYIAMEPLLGGCLFRHIRQSKVKQPVTRPKKRQKRCEPTSRLTTEAVKFYAAEVAQALLFVHSRGIVHRDIKSPNIVLNDQGHAVLIDFEFATFVPCFEDGVSFDCFGRCNTKPADNKRLTAVCGSLYYLAPEMLKYASDNPMQVQKYNGYHVEVDWWAFGVLCYEMVMGDFPFKHGIKPRDRMNMLLLKRIARGNMQESLTLDSVQLARIESLTSANFVSFLKQLLEFDPNLRLADEDIAEHAWWSDGCELSTWWQDVASNSMEPPPFDRDLGQLHLLNDEKND